MPTRWPNTALSTPPRPPSETQAAMILSVRPAKSGRFEARVGDRLLCTSRQPLLDAARIMLAEGVDPATPLTMRHERSSTDSLSSTVGKAAKLTVGEEPSPRFRPWVPFEGVRMPDRSAAGPVFLPPGLSGHYRGVQTSLIPA